MFATKSFFRLLALSLIVASLLTSALPAHDQAFASPPQASGDLLWTKTMVGATFGVYDYGYDIAVDSSGNVYTTGIFQTTVDFDPGPGTANLTSAGEWDIFVAKYTSNGELMWAKSMGGTAWDEGQSIAVDSAGNVYTTGFYKLVADFDPGPAVFELTKGGCAACGYNGIFISKLDSDGNFVWAKQIVGNSSEMGYGIAVDSSGNVYSTGRFRGTVDFDPGPGTANFTTYKYGGGAIDVYISKLDSSGNYVWARQFGGADYSYGDDIAVDSSGNVYSIGHFTGSTADDFDPGPGTATLTSPVGIFTYYVSKLDTNGNFVWVKQLGGDAINEDQPSIAVDSSGSVYTTGSFRVSGDFDPGPGTATLTSAGGPDAFISKLDTDGNYVWAKSLSGTGQEYGNGIAVDPSGNVYTTGALIGTADFDPGAGTANLTSVNTWSGNASDIYVSKLNSSGDFAWAKRVLGSTNGLYNDLGYSIAVDSNGNAFATGIIDGTDIFVSKFEGAGDTGAPETSIDNGPSDPNNNPSPSFDFHGDDGPGSGIASLMCQLDGGGYSACTSPFTSPALSDGSHTFEVYAIDNAANGDTSPASYSWTLDTTAPETTIDSGPPDPDNNSSPTFTFSGNDSSGIASFMCQMDGGGYSTCASPLNTSSELSDGPHTFEVYAVDNANNSDASPASYSWTLGFDNTAPETTIDSQPSDPDNNPTPSFSFSGTDASGIGSFLCQMDGGGYNACTSPFTSLALADGTHTFEVYAIDTLNNVDTSPATYTWTLDVDETAPETVIDSQPLNIDTNNTATFTFSGTDENGIASFMCELNDGGFSPCSNPFTSTVLPDGFHTFEVYAIDNANNSDASPASYSWTVDATAPETTIESGPPDLHLGNTPTFTFSGTDTVGVETFKCKVDDDPYQQCSSPLAFSYSVVDGPHTFSVYAIDVAGREDATPATYSWIADTTSPETTIDSMPPNPDNSTADPIFTFSGTDANGIASFMCKVDSGSYSPCTSPFTLPVSDGTYTFYVYAIDNAGIEDSSPAEYNWTLDATAPETSINSHPADLDTDSTPTFTFSGDDGYGADIGINGFMCKMDDGAYSVCYSPFTPYTELSDGPHTFSVYAIDWNYNEDATPASYTWTLEDFRPGTVIDSQPAHPNNDSTPTFTFSGTGPHVIASFMCKMDSDIYAACTSPFTSVTLADGSHTFSVYAISNAGNEDISPASYTWTVDTFTPNTSINVKPAIFDNDSTPYFMFSGGDNGAEIGGVASFTCQVDSGSFSICTSGDSLSTLSQGLHTFRVKAVDYAGNEDSSPASYTWTVDTIQPTTSIDSQPSSVNYDSTPIFTFSGSDANGIASFRCKVDGGSYAACTSPFTTSTLAPGLHAFLVYAVDPASNEDATPAGYTWTVAVDTTAPQTAIDSQPSNPSSDTTPAFIFYGVDNYGIASFQCKLDSGSYATCASPFTSPTLVDGSHTFSVKAIDLTGIEDATPASYTWTIVADTTAPETTINSRPSNPSTDPTPTFTFSGTDANGIASFQCKIDSGSYAACTSPFTSSVLSNGSHTFLVKAVDNAGNEDATPASYTWTVAIDTTPPQVSSILRASPNPTSANSVNFAVTFSEAVTGVDISDFAVTFNDVATGEIPDCVFLSRLPFVCSRFAIASVTPISSSVYTVTVNTALGNGSLGLNLMDNDSIVDAVSDPLGGVGAGNGNFTGETYTLQRPPIASPGIYDDTSTFLAFTGVWSNRSASGAFGGSYKYIDNRYTYDPGYGLLDTASIYFRGGQVKLYFTKNNTMGRVSVYIDGVFITEINQNSASPVYQSTWLSNTYPDGVHRLTVVASTSAISNVDAVQVIPAPDVTPPATINTLSAVSGPAYRQVSLQWTAVGDDNNTGTATAYRVRYALTPINNLVRWNAATPVISGLPTPTAPGTTQILTVSGLTPGLTYYFAVRAVDEVGNISPLSNSAAAIAAVAGPGTYENTNLAWTYFGPWTASSVPTASGGSVHTSTVSGNTAVIVVNGSSFTLRYGTRSGGGSLRVLVDGVQVATLSQNSASSSITWKTYTRALSTGSHVILLMNASGTVNFDNIVIAP